MDLDILKRRVRQFGRKGERNVGATSDFGGIEKNKFVNDACGESGAVEQRAGFQHDAQHLAAAEFGEHGGQINAAVLRFRTHDLDTSFLQFSRFSRLWEDSGEDQEVVVGSFNDAGFMRETQLRIEDNSQKMPAARQAAAVGKQWIIGENRPDASDNRVRSVAHAMNFRTDSSDVIHIESPRSPELL